MEKTRPAPTKQLLIDLCGSNQSLISSAHHGLRELSLENFYPYLDLNELIVFAASSWKSRKICLQSFSDSVKYKGIYELFSTVYKIGFPWLNKHKNIFLELNNEYKKLNPFEGKNLKARLMQVNAEGVDKLKKELQERVNEYVFECQYRDRKMARGGNNYKLEIMMFQPVFPKEEVIVPNFAKEIARIIRTYPCEYNI